jgi:DNA-binding CsgD family transcriptional regulator/tetratricopeptide (TPR) repeat protein
VTQLKLGASLVGRVRELEELEAAYERAAAGDPAVVLIAGETGIGKSRLIREFLTSVRARQATCLTGASPAVSGQELPFAPLAAALRGLREELGGTGFDSIIEPGSELARLAPGSGASGPASNGPGSQLRLFEEFLAMLIRLGNRAREGAVVFAIEDLQWTDDSTRDLLAYLVRNLSRGRVLILASYRDNEAMASEGLRRLLLESVRMESVVELELDPLDDGDALRLLASLSGPGLDSEHAAVIIRLASGNPLFIERLATKRSGSEIPRSLVNLFRDQVSRLAPATQQALRLLAAGGSRVPAIVLERCVAALEIDPVGALKELESAGMIEPVRSGAAEVHAFRHPILQEVIYADLISAERVGLHAQLATGLEAQLGDLAHQAPWITQLAWHWWSAGAMDRAFPALVVAAKRAEDMLAFAEAHSLYERALIARRAAGTWHLPVPRVIGFVDASARSPEEAEDLLDERTAQAASLAGHSDRAAEILTSVLSRAPEKPVALEARLGQYQWEAGQRAAAFATYRSAIARLPQEASQQRASILRSAARTFLLAGEYREAEQFASDAVSTAREAGAASDQIDALATLGAALAYLGKADKAVETLEQARQIEEERQRVSRIQPRPSRIVDLLSGYWGKAAVLDRAGEGELSAAAALDGLRRARELGVDRAWGGLVGTAAIDELIDLGRWPEAHALSTELLASPQPAGVGHALEAQRARLSTLRGDFPAALEQLSRARALQPEPAERRSTDAFALSSAELGLWTNQIGEAVETLELAVRNVSPEADPRRAAELLALALRAQADRATLARARRSSAEAGEAEREAATLHGRALALSGPSAGAPGRKALAFVEMATAEFRRAVGDAEASTWSSLAQTWAGLRDSYRAAYAQWRAAEVALAARTGRAAGTELLRAAHTTSEDLGARPLQHELEELARRARIDLRTDAPEDTMKAKAAPDTAGLSARELEVLGLLAAGQTNRQIGESLFITEKTAGHHVSSILSKLGVNGRVAAAGIALRMGLSGGAVGTRDHHS